MRKLRPSSDLALRAALAGALHESSESRFVHRVHAVLLVAVGQSCYRVAEWFGDDPRSVERWVHGFDNYGTNGLRDHHHGGRPARLSTEQRRQLAQHLANPPAAWHYAQMRWSGKLLARHLESQFSIQLSVRHCQRLLHPR